MIESKVFDKLVEDVLSDEVFAQKAKEALKSAVMKIIEGVDIKQLSDELTTEFGQCIESFDFCEYFNEEFTKKITAQFKKVAITLKIKEK